MLVTPQVKACDNFTDETDTKETVTVVIAPFRISKDPRREDAYTIAWVCSFADSCKFEKCYYSKMSRRDRPQHRERERGWPE